MLTDSDQKERQESQEQHAREFIRLVYAFVFSTFAYIVVFLLITFTTGNLATNRDWLKDFLAENVLYLAQSISFVVAILILFWISFYRLLFHKELPHIGTIISFAVLVLMFIKSLANNTPIVVDFAHLISNEANSFMFGIGFISAGLAYVAPVITRLRRFK